MSIFIHSTDPLDRLLSLSDNAATQAALAQFQIELMDHLRNDPPGDEDFVAVSSNYPVFFKTIEPLQFAV